MERSWTQIAVNDMAHDLPCSDNYLVLVHVGMFSVFIRFSSNAYQYSGAVLSTGNI